ncbi:MAG TPA: cell division protein SepF [Trebonia sp.]|jgi:cell division inhibitor SepF|nr:cell division protein SepF [Trebonia sp.]
MASAMRKMAVYLGLVEDDDRPYQDKYDAYEDYGEYDDDDAPDMTESSPGVYGGAAAPREAGAVRADYAGYPPAEPDLPQQVDLLRITTLHPRTYNEARTIGEHFREGTPVIMNLTEMVDSDARRLVDFAAGLIFGLRGSIDKVTNKVFLLSPANVEVTAEDKARIAERGFFNQS